jgi:hypothetical protein
MAIKSATAQSSGRSGSSAKPATTMSTAVSGAERLSRLIAAARSMSPRAASKNRRSCIAVTIKSATPKRTPWLLNEHEVEEELERRKPTALVGLLLAHGKTLPRRAASGSVRQSVATARPVRRAARPWGISVAPSVQTTRKHVAITKVCVNPVTVGSPSRMWAAMNVADS